MVVQTETRNSANAVTIANVAKLTETEAKIL